MTNDKLAKQGNQAPVQVEQLGYGQMMVAQDLPDKTLISRPMMGVWKLDTHFYVIEEYDKDTRAKVPVARPLLDGKMMIAALAGCHYETRVLERQPDFVVAEATLFYRDPTGEVIKFTREKEVSIKLEKLAAVTKKINGKLNALKGTYAGKGQDTALYNKINKEAMAIEDENKRQKYLEGELLDILDYQEIQDNMIKLRQTLVNMATSKALSSACTKFLQHIGQRVVFKGNTPNEIHVSLINTIAVPKAVGSTRAVNLLYADTPESEAIQTEAILKKESVEDQMPVNEAVVTENGAVDPNTGECLEMQFAEPENEPEPELTEQQIVENLIKEIKVMVIEQKMGKVQFNGMIEYHTDKKEFNSLTLDDLKKIHDLLRTPPQ